MSPIKTLEMVRLEAQNEANQFRDQDEKWERVKLVASMAVTLYCRWDDGTKTPKESMMMCVDTANHFVMAAEKLCQETKT